MAKTLSGGSAKPESGPHFSQESSTSGEPLLEKQTAFKEKESETSCF